MEKLMRDNGRKEPGTAGSGMWLSMKGLLTAAPYIVLALSLVTTISIWYLYDASLKARALYIFTDKAEAIAAHIVNGMHSNEQILRGGVGMFNASKEVSRDEWHRYVATLNLTKRYPGIQGLGYAEWIHSDKKEEHIRRIRTEGFPGYRIRPEGERPVYTSIIYLEPFDWRNQRAFGYDMFSEAVRRSAMEKARDNGETTIAARVTLLQETDKDMQSGMLMYEPVYRQRMPTDTVEKRRQAIQGFVYSPIRINDFIHATLGRMPKDIAFALYASDSEQPEALMFSSVTAEKLSLPDNFRPAFEQTKSFTAYGVKWLISFKNLPPFSKELNRRFSYAVLTGGVLISLLLTLVVLMLNAARAKAFETSRAITESEEQFRTLVKGVIVGVVAHGPDSAILFSNPMASTLLGLTDEQMRGKVAMDPAWCFLQENGTLTPREEYPVNRVLSSGEPVANQVLGIRRSDLAEPLWVQWNAYPVYDAGGHIQQVVVTFSDITGLKVFEQELQQKNAELENYTYTVSHDLKSPLITIQAYAGMIAKDLDVGKYQRARDDLKRIEGAVGKMTDLLNDLLELSRVGRQMNEPSPVDMNLLVKECLAQLAGALGGSQVEVKVQQDLPAVLGDPKRIAEVVQNLIENAIKYRGDQTAPRIDIGIRQEEKGPVFFVSDNGAGIDPLHQERIFGLFNKLDTHSEGTGIGLALVRRIIEVHGGRVWVESDGVGKGSRFCFTVPVS
jgi:two-component system, cell cycle sensor histidine kinase and response regulator CckA